MFDALSPLRMSISEIWDRHLRHNQLFSFMFDTGKVAPNPLFAKSRID